MLWCSHLLGFKSGTEGKSLVGRANPDYRKWNAEKFETLTSDDLQVFDALFPPPPSLFPSPSLTQSCDCHLIDKGSCFNHGLEVEVHRWEVEALNRWFLIRWVKRAFIRACPGEGETNCLSVLMLTQLSSYISVIYWFSSTLFYFSFLGLGNEQLTDVGVARLR